MGILVPIRAPEPRLEKLSDDALVAACGRGDPVALGELFDRFHPAVYRFLSRLAGVDGRDLDDLVQATFVEVSRGAGRFRGGSQARTWIFGIAANVSRQHVRGEARRKRALRSLADSPAARGERPDEAAERRELLARLGEAVGRLPHDLREAFVMCEIEEIAGGEAAAALGIREGTLWRRLHEARKALAEAIKGGGSR
jgi:RNA polymerase sigma-70 factor (ECF subfamily)